MLAIVLASDTALGLLTIREATNAYARRMPIADTCRLTRFMKLANALFFPVGAFYRSI